MRTHIDKSRLELRSAVKYNDTITLIVTHNTLVASHNINMPGK